MSTPRDDLAVPLALLELYGAIDLAVMQNPEAAPIIDQYLPGASENPGWSAQLYGLLAPDAPRLDSVQAAVTAGLTRVLLISEGQGATDEQPITIPDYANLVYAVGTLQHLGIEPPDNLYARVLALATPEGISDPLATANEFLNGQMAEQFSGWDSWPQFIKDAAAAGYVDSLVADVPQCRTGVVTVNGYESVVIDADCTSNTVTFNKLRDVMDPQNWPQSYPSFFCNMAEHQDCGDGWWSIKETAGICYLNNPDWKLITRLKYLKTDQTDIDSRLDFDLAPSQAGCDGRVKVDRGWINVTCTNPGGNPALGGVKMRTRKVAHVEGIDPYAQKILLCKLGYGWAAVQAFFGPAMDKPPIYNPYRWHEPPYKKEDPKVPGPGTSSGSGGASGGSGGATQSTGGTSGAPTTAPVLEVATKTAETLKETAEYLTDANLAITKKWLAGQLSFGDVAAYTGEVGAKLASEPWKWLNKIVTTGTGGGTSGSGGPTP
jgi:hypothetical protein